MDGPGNDRAAGSAIGPDGAERSRAAGRAREFADILVRWPSETGTHDEAGFSAKLEALIRTWPYFQSHPDQVASIASHGVPQASSVVALVRGSGSRCIALSGHYDTVSIANYASLAPLARDPDRLTAALIEELSRSSHQPAEKRALDDLQSGAFIPGRGMLDMKSGLAAGLACLERFARQREPVGNILFMAVPDEENRSRGMRSLRDALPELARRWKLEMVAGINLDSMSDLEDGTLGRSIYLGTVGKLLPFAFVVGQATHAGYPLEGVSAHLIGAEIMRAVEVNPDLCDDANGETAAPPVCLEAKDLRQGYDVTMPERTWLAFNWMSHRRDAEEVLALFRRTVQEAMERALERIQDNARRFYGAAVHPSSTDKRQGILLTFEELKKQAFGSGGKEAQDRYRALAASLETEENPLLVTRILVDQLVTEAHLRGPAVVIGFGSLYYPHTYLDLERTEHRRFCDILEKSASRISASHGVSIGVGGYFAGISDMSFFGHRPDEAEAAAVHANTPSPAFVDNPAGDILSFPVVNAGPWGREYHQKLERVHAAYAFDTLPDLLFDIACATIGATSG